MASAVTGIDPLGEYRDELFAHCYRMLGSFHDAEDVLQEVSLRAMRGMAEFGGRSSLRTWLHRIVVNACLNELDRKERRILPMDHGAAFAGDAAFGPPRTDIAWISPTPTDPYQRAEDRESIELAFVAAIQHLPPNQRAALVLFDVLGFGAEEIADLMATSTAAVNSALQRARATLASHRPAGSQQSALATLGDDGQRQLVRRYTTAMEEHDLNGLLDLVTEDATWSMPPLPNWYRGRDTIAAFLRHGPLVDDWRHLPTSANGQLAVGCYKRGPAGVHRAFCIDLLDVTADGRIASVTAFIDSALFAAFGLPEIFAADR